VVIGLSASRPHPNPPAAGEASAVAYDDRGNAIWTARQMAIVPFGAMYLEGDMWNYPGLVEGSGPSELHVTYDEEPRHTYIRTSEYDHAGSQPRCAKGES
jgi:hypothetical protein